MTSSNRNIMKARELYLNKGVLKRELLRDEIVYSWVRARLVNLDFNNAPVASVPEKTDLNRTTILESLFLRDYGIDPSMLNIKAILVLNSNGEIENAWRSNPAERFFFNFSEDSIGTSGIGLALKNMSKAFVAGHEHYHQYLVDTITIGIPTSENHVVGFIFDLADQSVDILALIDKMPEVFEFSDKKDDEVIAIDPPVAQPYEQTWPSCLVGESPAIVKARERVNKFMESQLIFISGPKGIGKESTATYIHQSRTEEASKFHAVYCDKIPLKRFESEWLENSDKLFKNLEVYEIGTVYFENFDALPNKYQRKLIRILDSKLVNSTAAKPSDYRDIAFIMSLTKTVDESIGSDKLTHGLQSRLKLAEIVLPGLTHRIEDVCSILGHMIKRDLESADLYAEVEKSDLFKEVVGFDFKFNLRDLDKIARGIVEYVSINGTLDNTCIEDILSAFDKAQNEEVVLRSLSEIEREAITNTLKALDFNMMRSASVLGISRSTLYRKLEQHQIEIESVRN